MKMIRNTHGRSGLLALSALLICLAGCHAHAADTRRQQVARQLENSKTIYTRPALWAVRQKALREGFLEGARLWPVPEKTPLNPIVHSRREHDGYTVENVALETLPGFYCTGNLYCPAGKPRKCPAVLCPHGHFRPLGRFRADQQVRCAHLARMGAVVFSYSMVGWQDATQTTHDDPLVLALQTWNSIRAVDYLTSLDEVDPERVGVAGASGGGTQALYLGLVDDRVKAISPVVIVYPWAAPDGCRCEGGMPVMQATHTNAIELAAALAPRPQLLISVGKDATTDFPKVGFPFIEHIYRLHGKADAVANAHFADEEHDFGPSKRDAVYAFFAKRLGLELKEEKTGTIPIEPPERMQVFHTDRPFPRHALTGSDAVAEAFAKLARPKVPPPDPQAARREAYLFTPEGFTREGKPVLASGAKRARLKIVVRDAATGKPTPCRVNVVGPDGNFYQPPPNDLSPYALTGRWPGIGRGNRLGKGPIRYYGRYFYCRGEVGVDVPPGPVRVEAFKGIEYRPVTASAVAKAGGTHELTLTLKRSVDLSKLGYYSGDPHLHLPRRSGEDDGRILDLLEAEDVRRGSIMAYNDPAGPYAGFMGRMDTPQLRGLGEASVFRRGDYAITSGQEYRSRTNGHLNLYLRDDLALKEQSVNADHWPLYGDVGRETIDRGGYAFYAHGGYAQAIYADFVQGNVHGVELLQFAEYRGIGLEDWYRILNVGYRFPCIGASDYPACRKLCDCITYVRHEGPPSFDEWFRGAAEGRSFVTTGPLLLLEVDGKKPGAVIDKKGKGPHRVTARVRVLSEVAPVTDVQIIVNGKVVRQSKVPAGKGRGEWIELKEAIPVPASSWVAARAFSRAPTGDPDAEAHTNPVFVYLDGKAPYDREALDVLVSRIEGQLAVQRRKSFPEKLRVLAYFEKSRDLLLEVRKKGGLSVAEIPVAGGQKPLNPGARTHTDEELREFLKPVPPQPPAEALKSFETVGGFRMELVAAEPLVVDPVAAAFDEDGKLYVAELRDYPYKPKPGGKPLGTVRLLEDADGDGAFDKSTVFADGLLWPAGIVPWKGGVFVAAAPDVWYLKDTDGDGKADVRRKVFTGFGTQNQQGMLNNLVLGIDHKVYGATSVNGGVVRPADKAGEGISLKGVDFSFDPVTETFEPVSGAVQFGNTFDDWGNRFLCSESQPLLHVVLPYRYLARNPHLPVPRAVHNIAPGPVPVFRISPLERWRVIRSARRIRHGERAATSPGASHHVIDAAAGVTIYRGGAYPKEYYGNVFVGGAQNNLIHRRVLTPDGPSYKSERADLKTEFARSSDNWFRPVNFVNAPDGALYVLDLSREVLEAIHIPLDVVKHLDLTSGRKYGRIFRLAPPGFRYPGPPRLGKAGGRELVAALESPHGWWRDTAHRLIYEQQDKRLAGPLRELLERSRSAPARLHALWSLQGLGVLTDADLTTALADPEPGLRVHALRLSESRLQESIDLRRKAFALAEDSDARVRFQAAFTVGEAPGPEAARVLAKLARKYAGDRWMRTAILSSAADSAHLLFAELVSDPAAGDLLKQCALVVGLRNQPEEVRHTLDALAGLGAGKGSVQRSLALSLGEGLRQAGESSSVAGEGPGEKLVSRLVAEALATAGDGSAGEGSRRQAVRLLACYPSERGDAVLSGLLDPKHPRSVQVGAVRALADRGSEAVPGQLLHGWTAYSPEVRAAALQALLSREGWTLALLRAAREGKASLAQIDPVRRGVLRKHRNPAIASLAAEVLGDKVSARKDVLAAYEPVLKREGDSKRGFLVFKNHCMVCHQVGGEGVAIGPDLTTSADKDPAAMLAHILDPNRFVLPNYMQYLVTDKKGRTYTGIITAESATTITLRREKEEPVTLLRNALDEVTSSGQSLMPEGLEKVIGPADMADLLAYLGTLHGPSNPPPLDIGTEPGLIEPDKRR